MTDVTISDRLKKVPSSSIRNLVPLAVQAKKNGVKVYHLNIGDPDIRTPQVMLDVLKNWRENPIAYAQSQGEPVFLDALESYYHRIGFPFITHSHIQVTSGGSEAISMAMFAVAQHGEEVVTFEPLYANYNSYAEINGVRLIPVTTSIQTGFHLPRVSEIERYITDKTRAILYCNPNNPTGTVYTKEEIDMLVALAQKYHLFLLADEVYREFTYDGRTHVSLLSYMENIPDKAIVLDSMSKRYSLCGARLGVLVSLNAGVMAGALRIAQGRLSAGLIDQYVASKLTEVPDSYIKEAQAEYSARRDVLYEGLRRIPGVVILKPEGAFYAIVGLPVDDAEKFCMWLLADFRDNNETVMLAPASGFYATGGYGRSEVRIAYVLNVAALKRCIDILAKALRQYPG